MPNAKYIVVDNFYENPCEVRNFALKQRFMSCHLPRYHTTSFANAQMYNKIQQIVYPFGGKITQFFIQDYPSSQDGDPNLPLEIVSDGDRFNGCFCSTQSEQTAWAHKDTACADDTPDESLLWAGVLYLTPNPPNNSGTELVSPKVESKYRDIDNDNYHSLDNTKWETTDIIENVFNRIVLFRSYQYHKPGHSFGIDLEDSRLVQIFFFKTEY